MPFLLFLYYNSTEAILDMEQQLLHTLRRSSHTQQSNIEGL